MDHPIRLVVTDDLKRSRLTVFFRSMLTIPHWIWLGLWGFAAMFVWVIAWFAALFTGHVPAGMHNFLAGYVRYQTHVFAYLLLAANPFPPFSGSAAYPVTVEIAPPAQQSRLTVFFRGIMSFPALFIANALNSLTYILAFFAWWVAMFKGELSEGMRNQLCFSIRYHVQTQGYLLLLTDKYPSLNVGLDAQPASTN